MTARNYGVPRMDRLTDGGSITAPKPKRDSERAWRIALAVALIGVMAFSFWGRGV